MALWWLRAYVSTRMNSLRHWPRLVLLDASGRGLWLVMKTGLKKKREEKHVPRLLMSKEVLIQQVYIVLSFLGGPKLLYVLPFFSRSPWGTDTGPGTNTPRSFVGIETVLKLCMSQWSPIKTPCSSYSNYAMVNMSKPVTCPVYQLTCIRRGRIL